MSTDPQVSAPQWMTPLIKSAVNIPSTEMDGEQIPYIIASLLWQQWNDGMQFKINITIQQRKEICQATQQHLRAAANIRYHLSIWKLAHRWQKLVTSNTRQTVTHKASCTRLPGIVQRSWYLAVYLITSNLLNAKLGWWRREQDTEILHLKTKLVNTGLTVEAN